jgi:hypothetical protein
LFEKKRIALLAAEALKQIPGTTTLGKQLNYLEIKRTAAMWLCVGMILIDVNLFHTIMEMSRAKERVDIG